MKQFLGVLGVAVLLLQYSCQKDAALNLEAPAKYTLRINFEHKNNGTPFVLGSTYTNPFNEVYTPTTLKYYISHLVLQPASGPAVELTNFYHLVDESDATTKTVEIQLEQGQFTSLSFTLGVDSLRNVSGTQTGDLDPAKGMFWTWNSGYIMAKLEGTSPASTATANKIEWHIGGFRTGENVLRQVNLNLAASPISIKANGSSQVTIDADINKWFKATHDLKISDIPVCASPGVAATRFADNYSKMFAVALVTNNE